MPQHLTHTRAGSPTSRACWRARHVTARVAAVVAVGALSVVLPGATASAHVRVHPDTTVSGGYAQLTFRVPDESPTAGTVKVEVELPQDHPLTSVSTTPVPGWSVHVLTQKLPRSVDVGGATITKAPRTVTWTAHAGSQIRPGEYQDFPISVGPLPAPGELVLPAVQTYTDGTVVRWDEQQAAGGSEPEHPAPSFTVTAADDASAPTDATSTSGGQASTTTGSTGSSTIPASTTAAGTTGSDLAARWLGGAALVVALMALALTGALLRRQTGAWAPRPVSTAGQDDR